MKNKMNKKNNWDMISKGNQSLTGVRGKKYGYLCTLIKDIPKIEIVRDFGNAAEYAVYGSYWVYFKGDILKENKELGFKKRIRLRRYTGDLTEAKVGYKANEWIEIGYDLFRKYFIPDCYTKEGLKILDKTCHIDKGVVETGTGNFIGYGDNDYEAGLIALYNGYRYAYDKDLNKFADIATQRLVDYEDLYVSEQNNTLKVMPISRYKKELCLDNKNIMKLEHIGQMCRNAFNQDEKPYNDTFVCLFAGNSQSKNKPFVKCISDIHFPEQLYESVIDLCYFFRMPLSDVRLISPLSKRDIG